MPRRPDPDPRTAEWLLALAQTELVSFTVSKASILPFEEVALGWNVKASDRVLVTLNEMRVSHEGAKRLTPLRTTTFVLTARAGPHVKELGRLTVEVDAAACSTISDANVDADLTSYWIENGIALYNSNPDAAFEIYFRTKTSALGEPTTETIKPTFVIQGGRATITLKLSAEIDDAPNPNIDLSLSFALDVENHAGGNRLKAVHPSCVVSIDVPWFIDLLPDLVTDQDHRMEEGTLAATRAGRKIIESFVEQMNLEIIRPERPSNSDLQSAKFVEEGQLFSRTYCPKLRPFAPHDPPPVL